MLLFYHFLALLFLSSSQKFPFCKNDDSCKNIIQHTHEQFIECSGTKSCENSTFYLENSQNTTKIICSSLESCKNTTFYCKNGCSMDTIYTYFLINYFSDTYTYVYFFRISCTQQDSCFAIKLFSYSNSIAHCGKNSKIAGACQHVSSFIVSTLTKFYAH